MKENHWVEVSLTTDFSDADIVGEWHARPTPPKGRPLHEFIGWTWEEYKFWVQTNNVPPYERSD